MANNHHAKDFKLVWVATVPRTGSMWCYNITRAILKELGYNVLPDQIPQSDRSMFELADAGLRDPNPLNIWTLKIHSRLKYDVPRSRIMSTFRDPRDSMISFMRFMRCDFDQALGATVRATGYYDYIREFPAEVLLCLKYKDIVDCPHEVVRSITRHLGGAIAPDAVEKIVANHSKQQVAGRIAAIEADLRRRETSGKGVLPGEVVHISSTNQRAFDLHTGFQTGHTSDYQDGEWAKYITDKQAKRMNDALTPWLAKNGYL